jgi:hypothetical protein
MLFSIVPLREIERIEPGAATHLGTENRGKLASAAYFGQILFTGDPIVFTIAVIAHMESVAISDAHEATARVPKGHLTGGIVTPGQL